MRCVQASEEPLQLESVVGGLAVGSLHNWTRDAAACAELSSALERAGFTPLATNTGPSWKLRNGCAIVIFSWGPHARWTTREAGRQARRLLSAGTKRPTRMCHVGFDTYPEYIASNVGSDACFKSADSVSDLLFSAVQSCVDRVGLRVSDDACRNAAGLLGQLHMPDNAMDMVLERFVLPLVSSIGYAGSLSRDRQLDILRRDAPFSGAAEFVEGLPEEALMHADLADWVRHFLVTQCCGGIPSSLDGLSCGRGDKAIGSAPVSAMSIAGTELPPYRTTSDPELLAAVERLLGPPPEGCDVYFHGTTLSSLESVMTDPSHNLSHHKHDFGTGLYTTSQPRQALAWALLKQGGREDDPPAVVAWYVRSSLEKDLKLQRCHYKYDAEFTSVVRSWRMLTGRPFADFKRHWKGSSCDIISGPVARLKPRPHELNTWIAAHDDEILSLYLNDKRDGGAPLHGDQHLLRTTSATAMLLDSPVCGVVLLPVGYVVRSGLPERAHASSAAAAGSGGAASSSVSMRGL